MCFTKKKQKDKKKYILNSSKIYPENYVFNGNIQNEKKENKKK